MEEHFIDNHTQHKHNKKTWQDRVEENSAFSWMAQRAHADSGTGQGITDHLRDSFALSIEKQKIYFTLRNLEAAKISGIKEVCLRCCEL